MPNATLTPTPERHGERTDAALASYRESRSLLDSNATCMRCRSARSTHVSTVGGRRMALCSTCASGRATRSAPRGTVARARQELADAMLGARRSEPFSGAPSLVNGGDEIEDIGPAELEDKARTLASDFLAVLQLMQAAGLDIEPLLNDLNAAL